MLTDIFANRYSSVTLWNSFEEKDSKFLVQSFRIISEQLFPYYTEGRQENIFSKPKWKILNDKLSTELGLHNLSSLTYTYPLQVGGQTITQVQSYPLIDVCKNFICCKYNSSISADRFMKERISFIEIAFRERANDFQTEIESFKKSIHQRREPPGPRQILIKGPQVDLSTALKNFADKKEESFQASVIELNTRFRQAGYNLNYHNGFIQLSTDSLIEKEIEEPFWTLVSGPIWKNVDTDMKEAIDRRDNQAKDPAFYAAKALESTIKIISDHKGWTHGGEKGAQNYLDNLASKKNIFITDWEKKSLADFFQHVRNPFGHGPGTSTMPQLTPQQTDWAIEFCMIWIKNLIRRM